MSAGSPRNVEINWPRRWKRLRGHTVWATYDGEGRLMASGSDVQGGLSIGLCHIAIPVSAWRALNSGRGYTRSKGRKK